MFRFGDPGGRMYVAVGTSNANLLAWWTNLVVNNNGTTAVSTSNGRTSGSSLRFGANGNSANTVALTKTLDSQATWGHAFAWRPSVLPATSFAISQVLDGGSAQCDLRVNLDGTLSLTRAGTVLGTTSSSYIFPNVYTHIEWKVTIHPSAGAASLWVNGVQRLNLTGLNTRNTANSTANVVAFGMITAPGGTSGNYDFDDIIVYDGQATDALGNADITGPIGDCRLALVPPAGSGAVTQFTALGMSPNYNCLIDVSGPDGDSTCVQSGTVGQTDTYTTAGLPAYATVVKAVAVVEYARKTDAGVRTLSPVIRSGGGNSVHPTANTLGTNYQYFFNNWGQNPNNGSPTAWTQAGVNAIEIGQQVSG